jgi:hypothetical protein
VYQKLDGQDFIVVKGYRWSNLNNSIKCGWLTMLWSVAAAHRDPHSGAMDEVAGDALAPATDHGF